MSLGDWLRRRWLSEQRPARQAIAELLMVVDRDLNQSQTPGLDADWRLTIAYNAALQCATAALAAAGYRVGHESHHYRVIQSLGLTIGWPPEKISAFDRFRRKRNAATYERAGATSEQDADDMLCIARRLRQDVQAWLETDYPELL